MKIELGQRCQLAYLSDIALMGLSYKFTLRTTVRITAWELEHFLKSVEAYAKRMGFKSMTLFAAKFETSEQRQFASRLGLLHSLTSEQLQGDAQLDQTHVVDFNPIEGRCRILPDVAVMLIVTDERQAETVFAFLSYPRVLKDINGLVLLEIPFGLRWHFDGCIQSPDPRYRKIIKRFAKAGYVLAETDEFYPKPKMTKAEFDVVISRNQVIQKRNPFGSKAHRGVLRMKFTKNHWQPG